jgi:hypothetical protein
MNGDTVEIIKSLGLPVGLAVVFMIFFVRAVWPWTIKQTEIAQQQTRVAQEHERTALEAVAGVKEALVSHTELARQMVEILKELQKKPRR